MIIPLSKHALGILYEAGMLNVKPVVTPMDLTVNFVPDQGELFSDPWISRLYMSCWECFYLLLAHILLLEDPLFC